MNIKSLMEYSSNNFNTRHERKDFFTQVQKNSKRIGEVGEVSEDFVDRAFKQFQNHDYHKLAQIQDEFVAPSDEYGTTGREKNRNLNRMEYDPTDRFDGKSKEEVAKKVNKETELTVSKILNSFKDHGYTLNNTASAVGFEPITKGDYDKQMTTDK